MAKKKHEKSPDWQILYEMNLQQSLHSEIDRNKSGELKDYLDPQSQKQSLNNRVAEFIQEMIDSGRIKKMDRHRHGLYYGITKGGLKDVILKDLEKTYGAKFYDGYSYKRLGKMVTVKAHVKVPFTKQEESILKTALAAKVDTKKIAEQLGRTPRSITDKAYRLSGARKKKKELVLNG